MNKEVTKNALARLREAIRKFGSVDDDKLAQAELDALKSEEEVLVRQLEIANKLAGFKDESAKMDAFIMLGEILGFNHIDVYAPGGDEADVKAMTFSTDEEYITKIGEIEL